MYDQAILYNKNLWYDVDTVIFFIEIVLKNETSHGLTFAIHKHSVRW